MPKMPAPEIPFDVADWGDRVVPPLYETEAERQAFLASTPDPAYADLQAEALRLEALRVG